MTSETAAKKDIQKLQRAIIDGLEDVKAQDIVVFDTEALSPLFERVIVASGTSNRHTKALSASIRDAVREAGFDKPRIEGQENGEWIIVDCGAAVAHVMQPVIRQYYRLEEIWGQKPVRLKFGAPKPAQPEAKSASKKVAKKSVRKPVQEVAPVSAKSVVRKAAQTVSKAAATKVAAKPVSKTASKAPAKKAASGVKPALKTVVIKPKSVAKPAAKSAKPAAKSATKPAAKAAPRAPGRKKA
jgi:ribosome-associated protein